MISAAVQSKQEHQGQQEAPSLDAGNAAALEKADPAIPEMVPGITDGIRYNPTIGIITAITSHPEFPFVVRTISDAFKLDVPRTAQTRDGLVHHIKGNIPALKGYELMHLIRSLSYVYAFGDIAQSDRFSSDPEFSSFFQIHAGRCRPATRSAVGECGGVWSMSFHRLKVIHP